MGSQLASLYHETEMELRFRELSTDAQWGIRLGKLGVSILCGTENFIHSNIYPVRKLERSRSLLLGREIHICICMFYMCVYVYIKYTHWCFQRRRGPLSNFLYIFKEIKRDLTSFSSVYLFHL